jgi:organic hydroperoxide reductase OsmC/OhrA
MRLGDGKGELDLGVQDHVVELDHQGRYSFLARFVSEEGDLEMNEPEPLGPGGGPEGVSLLAAAAGYCMSASLVFCMRKVRAEPKGMRTEARAHLHRVEKRLRRVTSVELDIHVELDEGKRTAFERCLRHFTEFCIVTESIRGAFPIMIRVHHPWGIFEKVLEEDRDSQ